VLSVNLSAILLRYRLVVVDDRYHHRPLTVVRLGVSMVLAPLYYFKKKYNKLKNEY
jgi:hypothetical protein